MNRESRRKQKKSKAEKVVLRGKGKEYSEISNNVVNLFEQWLIFSNYDRKMFERIIKHDVVTIKHEIDSERISISLVSDDSVIGTPFIWVKENNIPLKNYWIDVLLLLTYISSLSEKDAFLDGINELKTMPFVKKYL